MPPNAEKPFKISVLDGFETMLLKVAPRLSVNAPKMDVT